MAKFPGVSKEQLVNAIDVHAAKIENDMREWFKSPEGEKATFEQANDHRMELERPYVMDAVRGQLFKKAPAVITTREEYNLLPAGAAFVLNGKSGVKH